MALPARSGLLTLLASFAAANHVETQRWCLETSPLSDCRGCTANDVSFTAAYLAGAAQTCTIGQSISINVNVNWASTTAGQRYQVASYIAMDGGDARTGSCYPYYLHGPGANNGVSTLANNVLTIGSPTALNNNGPFPDFDGDQCGDISQGQNIWQTVPNITLVCRDFNNDGTADFKYCMGWNNQGTGNGAAQCRNISTAVCNTPSKCTCGSINIQGLTVCSSQQQLCRGNDGQVNTFPCEPSWSAKVKITSSATSTVFPKLTVLYADAYLDYQGPTEELGLVYYSNQLAPFNGTAGREDILFPCKTNTYTFCGGTCSATFNKNWVPRIFHEGSYAIDIAAGKTQPDVLLTSGCPALDDSTINVTALGLSCFRKTFPPTGVPPEAIQYIWAKVVNSRWQVFAALAVDGTLWEMFLDNGIARGVYLAASLTATSWRHPFVLPNSTSNGAVYNFDKYNSSASCGNANPPCTSAVDVVYFVDQKNPTLDGLRIYDRDFLLSGTSNVISYSNANTRFGVSFSGNPNTAQQFIPAALSASVTPLVSDYYAQNPTIGGAIDFAGMIRQTLIQYWCGGVETNCAAPPANGNPRRLVVVVHGSDTPGATAWSTVWNLYNLLGVQVFVEAVGNGTLASNNQLLLNIVNGNAAQITSWPFEIMLPSDSLFLYRRLCPATTSVCACGGFCSCSGTSLACTCPTCLVTDVCNPSVCSNPSLGCQVDAAQKVICNPPDRCKTSVCVDSNGANVAGGTASCVVSNVTCPATNICREPYCDPSATSVCQGRAIIPSQCNDGNACTIDGCDANLNGGQGGCTNTPIPYSVLNPNCGTNPCLISGTCPTGTPCSPVTCIQSLAQCSQVVDPTNRTACQAQWATPTSPGYYCSRTTVNCTGQNDACNIFSCNSTSGLCVSTPTVCDQIDICSVRSCTVPGGCSVVTARNPATACPAITCKVPACVVGSNTCTYSNSTALECQCAVGPSCPANTPCSTTTCINTGAQCDSTIADSTTRATCNSEILAGRRYCFTLAKACPPADQCTSYACNAVTGVCDPTPIPCVDADKCSSDICANGVCSHVNLTAADLAQVCPSQTCRTTLCPLGTNTCAYALDFVACSACTIFNPTVPAATFCSSSVCVDARSAVSCAGLIDQAQRSACLTNVSAGGSGNGYYVGQVAKAASPCPPNNACTNYTCTEPNSCPSASILTCTPNLCQTASCDAVSGCVYTPKSCPANDICTRYQCNIANGNCDAIPQACTDNDVCTFDTCANGQCTKVPLTAAQLAVVCPPRSCYIASCVVGSNNCTYVQDTNSCAGCNLANPTIPASTFCYTSTCVDSRTPTKCSDLISTDQAGCNSVNVTANAATWFFVGKVTLANVCPADNFCRNYTCDDSGRQCVEAVRSCTARTLCETASCDVASSACVYTPKPCPANTFCTNYTCNNGECVATANTCDDNDKCTVDSCAGSACVRNPLSAAQLAVACPPVACKTASCSANSCSYANDFTACSACTIFNPTIPANTFCASYVCVDANSSTSCSGLLDVAQRQACVANVTANNGRGYYVGQVPVAPSPCQANDFCTNYTCQESPPLCVPTSRVCSPASQCETASCSSTLGRCVSANLTQSALNAVCSPIPACRLPTCVPGSACTFVNDPSLACACTVGSMCAAFPDTFCTQTTCINTNSSCNAISDPTTKQACLDSIARNSHYCLVTPKSGVCQVGDYCLNYRCTNDAVNASLGSCVPQTGFCAVSRGNKCEKGVCANGACGFVLLSAAEQTALCSDGNGCTDDLCDNSTGACANPLTPASSAPTACLQCTSTSCPTGSACAPIFCIKSCADPSVLNVAACNAAVVANGTYCEARPVVCPANDFCTNWTCVAGTCVSSPAFTCDNSNPCSIGQCSVTAGKCLYTDPCVGVSFGSQPCLQPQCQLNVTDPTKFTCFGAASPARDCADYLCKATGVQSEIVIGQTAKAKFESDWTGKSPSCTPILCTVDSCDPNLPQGCVNTGRSCLVPLSQPCNASVGCYEAGNVYSYAPGECIVVTVQSLIDFCGVCLGDNIACFFAAVNNAAVAGGIAAGAVAGIVVGAVIAALIALWASRKGYEYYRAQSQMSSTGAYTNPAFQESSNQGQMI